MSRKKTYLLRDKMGSNTNEFRGKQCHCIFINQRRIGKAPDQDTEPRVRKSFKFK